MSGEITVPQEPWAAAAPWQGCALVLGLGSQDGWSWVAPWAHPLALLLSGAGGGQTSAAPQLGVVAAWVDEPQGLCTPSCRAAGPSARLRFGVNAGSEDVGCSHGWCASSVWAVSGQKCLGYDDERVCCCAELLRLCVTAGWAFSLSSGGVSPGWQEGRVMLWAQWCRVVPRVVTLGCVCGDVLPAGTNVPVCELLQTHLLGSSQCAEVPKGFRSPLCWGIPGAGWVLGCPALAVPSGVLGEVLISFSLTHLAPVMRFESLLKKY